MAAAVGSYQHDASQPIITSIDSRKYNEGDSIAGPTDIKGAFILDSNAGDKTAGIVAKTDSELTTVYRWTSTYRTANETRPSNVSFVCGLYLGRTAKI